MASQSGGDVTCPSCHASLDRPVGRCPDCGEMVLEDVEAMLEGSTVAGLGDDLHRAPRWAVLLTGLALGIPLAPLVVYALVIAGVDLSVLGQATLALATWLSLGWYLSRFPNPSAALARGLYLVVAGIGVVLVAVVVDASSGQPTVETDLFVLVLVALAVPAVVAVLLARRVANRAARQARGEPGRLHELAGVQSDASDRTDDTDS